MAKRRNQAALRMHTAADLHALAQAMQLENFRRRHPRASPQRLGRLLLAWLGYEGYKQPDDPDLEVRKPRTIHVQPR